METLMAAIGSGAGSVYFGVGNLNMRSRSSVNFSLDDMKKISRIAGDNGVRTYLSLNVEIFDNELKQVY
jgi:putative protease